MCTYTPDFYLPTYDMWVEAKGKWDGAGRNKTLAILGTSGTISRKNFRILFMYDNWITKKHTQKYSNWCENQAILYTIGINEFLHTLEREGN
jgi:hypothetical protein